MVAPNVAILNICDSHPSPIRNPNEYSEALSNYTFFQCNNITLGYLLRPVVAALRSQNSGDWIISSTIAQFNPELDTFEKKSAAMKSTVDKWRREKRFEVLAGWRNELYPVYGPGGETLFAMERCATPLFGVVTFGVHMTVYVPPTQFHPMRIWTPRRSRRKPTYPGMLDNTVAGGIAYGTSVIDTLVKEAEEEASLHADLVRTKAAAAGAVSYFYIRESSAGGEEGLLQPEVQYVYDLAVSEDIIPRPNDDEVEDFRLMTLHEVQERLAAGEFKPNCALVLLDFFIRHGILTPENESSYLQIVSRVRTGLPFPLPS